jgi:transcriptional regulator with XRE-family HTH domain
MPPATVRRARRGRLTRRRQKAQYPDLATYIRKTGDTQEAIARAVGVSQAAISRIVTGDHRPRPDLALRLAVYARIPLDSFTRNFLIRRAARLAGRVA